MPKPSQKHTGGADPIAVWLDELSDIWDAPPALQRGAVVHDETTDTWTIHNLARVEVCKVDDIMVIDQRTGLFHVVTQSLLSHIKENPNRQPGPTHRTSVTNPRAQHNPRGARGNSGRNRGRR